MGKLVMEFDAITSFYAQHTFGQWIVILLAWSTGVGALCTLQWSADGAKGQSWFGLIWGAFCFWVLFGVWNLLLLITDTINFLWNGA